MLKAKAPGGGDLARVCLATQPWGSSRSVARDMCKHGSGHDATTVAWYMGIEDTTDSVTEWLR